MVFIGSGSAFKSLIPVNTRINPFLQGKLKKRDKRVEWTNPGIMGIFGI